MSDTTNINDLCTDPAGPSNSSNNINFSATEKTNSNNNGAPTQAAVQSNLDDKSPGINLDESTIHQIISGLHQASNTGVTKLPSRDIPMSTNTIVNDPYTQQDFVPPAPNTYIPPVRNSDIIDDYNKNKKRVDTIDDFFNEFQIPILLSIIYFIFQLPFLKKFLFSNIPFLYNVDGNLNLKGLIFKSCLFGITYYSLDKSSKTFSKF